MDVRRIRISFSDPDATESDSGDDASHGAAKNAAGKTTEIVILLGKITLASRSTKNPPASDSKAQGARSSSAAASSSGMKRGAKTAATSSAPKRRFRGVYERQPGRWAAEFRSHRLKVRHWLGTFTTEAAAKAAYDAFEAQLRRGGGPTPASSPERGVHHRAAPPHAPEEKRQIVLALSATTTVSSLARSAVAVSVPSTPCSSSCLTSASPPPPPSSEHARSRADVPAASLDLFPADEPADEDLIGLADLGGLPLPVLDGNLDFDMADLSLFDNGFL